jgi:hypothetical protein
VLRNYPAISTGIEGEKPTVRACHFYYTEH